VLIVAPRQTLEQWRQAAFDFDDGCTVVGAGKNDIPVKDYIAMVKEGRDTNDVVIVGPEYWTKNQARLREAGFDGLIVDEVVQWLAAAHYSSLSLAVSSDHPSPRSRSSRRSCIE
jgi:hypothetical protein